MSFSSGLQVPIYRLFLRLYRLGISVSAAAGNQKAAKWIEGRNGLLEKIETDFKGNKADTLWMHCASLGEFEQGRTLLEMIRSANPQMKIVLTFFSPSGYEVRKNYHRADHVYYLPLDSRKNARRFNEIINPKVAVFIKYEFWYHYFHELNRRKIPLILVSAIFRKKQPFFQWYGALHREMLKAFSHIFVQDKSSIDLVNGIGLKNVTLIPDTRIDRVSSIAVNVPSLPSIEGFLEGKKAWIGGSIYREENEMLLPAFRNGLLGDKLILAPHSIDEKNLADLMAPWGEDAVRYTRLNQELNQKKVLFIDTMGMLSALYRYGSAAFIGGGFGKGIHNILEPAAFGIPIVFGPNYHKFREAEILVEEGGALVVRDKSEFETAVIKLGSGMRSKAGPINKKFIEENTGGSQIVFNWLKKYARL